MSHHLLLEIVSDAIQSTWHMVFVKKMSPALAAWNSEMCLHHSLGEAFLASCPLPMEPTTPDKVQSTWDVTALIHPALFYVLRCFLLGNVRV